MSHAMSSIVAKLFAGKNNNIRVTCSTSDESLDLLSDFLVELGDNIKVTLDEPNMIKKTSEKKISPTILIVHSMQSFNSIADKLSYDNLRFREFYLLVLTRTALDLIDKILSLFWSFWIHKISLMVEVESGSVSLFTIFPFGNGSCGEESSLTLINSFDAAKQKWKSDTFFPEKFKNLNLCPLKAIGQSGSFPSVIVNLSADGNKSFTGIEVDLLREIAAGFNCSTQFEDYEVIGSILPNGTAPGLGIIPSVFKRRNDVAIGTLSLQLERASFLSETKSFLSVPIAIVVPPARIISPFQKLIRPFTDLVWYLLFAVFIIGFLVIVLAKFSSKLVYTFIVGVGITAPVLNMATAFLGSTQRKLPSNNFARYLLMKFLLFCLVVRCLYQGKLFIMLQTELREKQVDTIDDMVNSGMVLHIYESMSKRISGLPFANRFVGKFRIELEFVKSIYFIILTLRTKAVTNFELESYRHKTLDPLFNGVVFSYLTQVLYMNLINRGNFSYLIAKELFVNNQLVFYFQRNHFLAEKFSKKIDSYREAGLIDEIISRYVDVHLNGKIVNQKSLSPLTLSKLAAIFGVWLSGLVVSIVAFFFESIKICQAMKSIKSRELPPAKNAKAHRISEAASKKIEKTFKNNPCRMKNFGAEMTSMNRFGHQNII